MQDFISYGKQWIDENDIQAVVDILRSDYLTQGPAIEKFENRICELTGARYCIAVSSATAALHLAVMVLNIPSGYEGITSPNTFLATSNALIYNQLKPVFADIDPLTYNINTEQVKKKINNNTKVLLPVHFAGQTCDMEVIFNIAKSKNLFVIEDAAHAIGSKYHDGSMVGNCRYSNMTVFSFHPVKTIATGEGGAITTNNPEYYEKLKILRSHGIVREPDKMEKNPGIWYYEMQELGFNYRMTDMQAALGLSQLTKIHKFISRRREIVNQYNQAFAEVKNITLPYEKLPNSSAFHLYVIQLDFEKIGKSRNNLMMELKTNNIGTQVHYIPVHTQPYYRENYNYNWGDFPIAESYYDKALSIPLYPKMTDEEIKYVINTIKKIINS